MNISYAAESGGPADHADDNPGMHAFSRSVLQIMENVEYRLCEGGEDLEDIYRLRYASYLKAGMISPNGSRMVVDEFDGLPNCYLYGVYYDGHLVSTIRLHHVTQEFPQAPSVKVFSDIVKPRLAAGETFVDPSRLAADPEWTSTLRVLPYISLRLAVVACHHFKPNACLNAIKEEHSAFYRRIFRTEALVRGRTYPGLTVPVDLWQAVCPESPDQAAHRFAFFRSTVMERRMLFTKSNSDYAAPLTILPSSRLFSRAA